MTTAKQSHPDLSEIEIASKQASVSDDAKPPAAPPTDETEDEQK
jgi:hypothetical protein